MIDIKVNIFATELRLGANNSSSSNKVHEFSRTEHRFVLIQIVPLRVYYMFRPVHRPSSGTSLQKTYEESYNKI